MTRHDPVIRLRHMRDHAHEAIEMLGDRSLEELRDDRMLQLALIQLQDIRNAYPSVPWQLATDMRNKLIHGYDVIEFDIIYDTVKQDLPTLATNLNTIIADAEK